MKSTMGGMYSTHEEIEKMLTTLQLGMLNKGNCGGHCYCILLIPVSAPSIVGSSESFMRGHPVHSGGNSEDVANPEL